MMSNPPKAASAASTSFCGNSGRVMSPARQAARPPAERMAASVSAAGAGSRSLIITAAPAPASVRAISRPIPRPPPVTSATLDSSVNMALPQQVLELDLRVGAAVPVLHNHRRVHRNAPVFSRPAGDGARPGHQYSLFGDHQRLVLGGPVDLVADQVVDRGRAVQESAGSQHGALLHHRALVDPAIAA